MTVELRELNLVEGKNVSWKDGYYYTVFSLDVPEGRGYGLDTEDILQITASNVLTGCDIRYFKAHKNINHSKMLKFMKNFKLNKRVTSATANEGDEDDFRNTLLAGRARHYNAYEQLKSSDDSVGTAFKWRVVIRATSIKLIEEQLEIIRDNWDGLSEASRGRERLKYFELNPVTGAQGSEYSKLFDDLDVDDPSISTSTPDNYSGLDFYLVSTLQDDNGVKIGYDTFSTAQNTIMYDFVRSTHRRAAIAIPKNASHIFFKRKDKPSEISPISSVLAQACANQFVMENHKVVHFVLNDFDYGQTENADLYSHKETDIQKIDVSTESVNVIQAYGSVEDQKMIYQRMQSKISLIFDILQNFTLDNNAKAQIEKALRETYNKTRKWSTEADKKPNLGKLVNQNPELFPTLSTLAATLETQTEVHLERNLSELATATETLVTNLDQVIENNKTLLGRATSLRLPTAEQTYYEFAKVGDDKTKMLQFVNIINYVSDSLKEGDLIVIHGANKLDGRLFDSYLKEEFDAISKKNVRVLYSFDNTTEMDNSNIFSLGGGRAYSDFDLDFDWAILGRVPLMHIDQVEHLFNQSLTSRMSAHLASQNVQSRVLIRRRETATLHFCDLLPFI